ncbi:hypothetical protein ACFLTO_04885 [Chloroflexota bacterium]
MWQRKRIIIIGLLATVLLVGSVGGVALAQAENGEDSQPKTLLTRVAEKLGIGQQELEDAFAEAKSEMRDEALDSYLQKLIDEGKITEEEAVQYKAWLEAKPDTQLPKNSGRFGGHSFQGKMKRGGGCYSQGK